MKRIQRKRTKGWRMPANTKYIGRGSKWGNPFKVEHIGLEWLITCEPQHIETANKIIEENPAMFDLSYSDKTSALQDAVRLYRKWSAGQDFSELAGHDLACWCGEGEICHGDVILERLK